MSFLKNRTVLGAICIVLSLIICFALTPLFNQSVSQKTTVVRVVKDIQSGEQITKDMVQAVEVGGYNLPDNVMKKADSVIGKYAKADLSPGDYILAAKLSDSRLRKTPICTIWTGPSRPSLSPSRASRRAYPASWPPEILSASLPRTTKSRAPR